MKITQRLDYNRLAEVLAERNMVEPAAIHELLNASNDGGQAFPERADDSSSHKDVFGRLGGGLLHEVALSVE